MNRRFLVVLLMLSAVVSIFASGTGEPAASNQIFKLRWTHGFWGAQIDPENNFAKTISDKLKVDLTMDFVPQGQLSQQYQVIFNSGNLPDMITVASARSVYADWARKGLLVDLTPYWDAKQYPLLAANVSKDMFARSTRIDKGIYGIPCNWQNVSRFNGVRGDWLAKFGLSAPKTFAELKNYARLVVEKDPDGNGKNDTYALGLDASMFGAKEFFFAPFRAGYDAADNGTPEMVWNGQGQLDLYFTQPRIRDVISEIREWYQNGWIDPASITQKPDFQKNTWEAGRYGMGGLVTEQISRVKGLFAKLSPPGVLTILEPLEGPAGKNGIILGSGWYRFQGITAAADSPAKIRKILDIYEWLLTDEGWQFAEFGVKGVHWDMVNGVAAITPKWTFDNGVSWTNFGFIMNRQDPKLIPSADLIYTEDGKIMAQQLSLYNQGAMQPVILPSTPDDLYEKANAANRARNTAVLQIIIGERPVGDLGKITETWLNAGAQAWFDACKKIAADAGLSAPK